MRTYNVLVRNLLGADYVDYDDVQQFVNRCCVAVVQLFTRYGVPDPAAITRVGARGSHRSDQPTHI